jgi:hypothetical protein
METDCSSTAPKDDHSISRHSPAGWLRLAHAVVVGLLAIALSVFVYKTGRKGLYMFDTGISYHYGWLIYNGWLPFRDFITPLMPLSGMICAIGFALFGVTYVSGVIMAALLSSVGFLVVYSDLRRLLPFGIATFFALGFVFPTLSLIGVPYYNHLCMLIVAMICSSMLGYLCIYDNKSDPRCNRRAGYIYFLIGLLGLCKLHVGLLYFVAFFLVDLVHIGDLLRRDRKSPVLISLLWRFLPVIVLTFTVLAWLRFDFHQILVNLAIPTPKVWDRPLREVTIPFTRHGGALLTLSLSAFALMLITMGGYLLASRTRNSLSWRLLFLGMVVLVAQLVFCLSTPENANISFPVMVFIITVVCLAIPDHRMRQGAILLAIPLVATLLISAGTYAYHSTRKIWDERDGTWRADAGDRSICRTRMPFFTRIRIRPEQKVTLDYLQSLLEKYHDKSIFFGGELELIYAASGRLPPRGWPNWLHIGHSVRESSFQELAESFRAEDYDVVILARQRFWMTKFLDDQIANRYTRMPNQNPDIFIEVFVKKGMSSASN